MLYIKINYSYCFILFPLNFSFLSIDVPYQKIFLQSAICILVLFLLLRAILLIFIVDKLFLSLFNDCCNFSYFTFCSSLLNKVPECLECASAQVPKCSKCPIG